MEFINTGLDERILKSLDVEHPSEELVKAMNKQGLVQKEVTVQGKNGTFTRKQWVKASEGVKTDSSSPKTGGPVDISKFSFTNYRNPDGQNRNGYKTYRDSLQSVANETEKAATRVLSTYGGSMKPYDQLRIEFGNINGHSSYRDMISNSSQQGLKDAKSAIVARQKELLESVKDYTKWDSTQRKWVKDSEAKDAGTSQSTTKEKSSKSQNSQIFSPESDFKLKNFKWKDTNVRKYKGDSEDFECEIEGKKIVGVSTNASNVKVGDTIIIENGMHNEAIGIVQSIEKTTLDRNSIHERAGIEFGCICKKSDGTEFFYTTNSANDEEIKIIFNENSKSEQSTQSNEAKSSTKDTKSSNDSSKTPQENIEKKSDKSKGAQQPIDLSSESSRKDFSSKFDEIYRLVTNASLSNQLARNGYSQSIGGSKLPKDAVSSLKKQLSEMKKQASDAGYTIDYNHNCELKPKKEQKSSQPSAGQKSKSSEVFNCTEFNTEEQLIDVFDTVINSGEDSTSDYDVNKVVVTKVEKYMGNGVKGRGTVPRVRITAEVSGVQNGKPFTKETTLSTLDTTKSSQSSTGQKLSPADAKKKTQEITKGISDKKSFMEKAKAQGITWKENDHEGINWMRCCMSLNKHFENGGSFDEK